MTKNSCYTSLNIKLRGSVFMKRLSSAIMALIFVAVMLFGACANPPEEDFSALNPTNTAPALSTDSGNASDTTVTTPVFVPLTGEKQMTDTANDSTFVSRILMDGVREDLAGGMVTAPIMAIAGLNHYIYRDFPQGLTESASTYYTSSFGLRQIEVYANSEPTICNALIPLTGNENVKLVPRAMAADKDGFTVLYTVIGMNPDGTPSADDLSRAITQYDMGGQERVTTVFALPEGERLSDVFVAGDTVYVQTTRYNPSMPELLQFHGERTLYTLDMDSGALTTLTVAPYIAATTYADGQLLLMSLHLNENTRTPYLQLDVLDMQTGAVTPLSGVIINDYDIIGERIAYDAHNGALYFTYNNILHSWLVKTASPIFPLSEIPAHDLLAIGQNLLVTESNGTVHLLSQIKLTADRIPLTDANHATIAFGRAAVEEDSDATKIRILTDSYTLIDDTPLYLMYIEEYMRDTLGVSIKIEPVQITADQFQNEGYQDKLAAKLLAGDSTFDLFLLGPSQESIRNKAYFQSFEGYDVARHFDAMLPGVRELCEIDGQLSLIPLSLEFPALAIFKDTAAAVGIDYTKIPGSADGFLDFMEANRAKLTAASVSVYEAHSLYAFSRWYMPVYEIEFMAGREGTGQTFYDFLSVLDRIQNLGLFEINYNGGPYNGPTLKPSQVLCRDTFINGAKTSERDEIDYIPFPKLHPDDPMPLHGSSQFLGVNPMSQNADIVQLLTETLVDIEFQRYVHSAQGSINREDVTGYCRDILYDYPEFTDNRNFGFYKDMLANSAWYNIHALNDGVCNQAFYDYCYEGNITAEEFKTVIDRALEFLRDE